MQWGNVAGLVTGLLKEDYDLIGRSLQDVIVEPIRSLLIPGFDTAKAKALGAGALGCSISGSGPSIFALSQDKDTAHKIGEEMTAVFDDLNVESEIYISKVSEQGPKILKD